ncbi:MAG: 4-hydroxy-tetrahydrodipicolinate reductase [Desulfovibrionaceae bacterium]|nr:4-hydroxy-tetrahydrodipicolinate reductase [Desulfovibrionaceae bacterium]
MSLSIVVMGAAGRMGSAIARLAAEQHICIAAVLERSEHLDALSSFSCLKGSDPAEILPQAKGSVVIDFTAPEATINTARIAAENGNPMVIGTTGLSAEQLAELDNLAEKTPMFRSPNMSIGVNVLLDILPRLVKLLGPAYDLELTEIHHHHKKDSPSGTALRLAECLAEARSWKLEDTACCGREGIIGARPQKQIGIQAVRGGDVVGVHTVYCLGPGEQIEVTHRAQSRDNFAQGALHAASWLYGQQSGRMYSMQDILNEREN